MSIISTLPFQSPVLMSATTTIHFFLNPFFIQCSTIPHYQVLGFLLSVRSIGSTKLTDTDIEIVFSNRFDSVASETKTYSSTGVVVVVVVVAAVVVVVSAVVVVVVVVSAAVNFSSFFGLVEKALLLLLLSTGTEEDLAEEVSVDKWMGLFIISFHLSNSSVESHLSKTYCGRPCEDELDI